MEKYVEIGEYMRAIEQANVRIVQGNGGLAFNGQESSTAYLRDLLNPEIYLYRVIRGIFAAEPELCDDEDKLMNGLEQLKGLFYTHPDTGQLYHKNLKIEGKAKSLEYKELSVGEREWLAACISEQQDSLTRVRNRVMQCQTLKEKK